MKTDEEMTGIIKEQFGEAQGGQLIEAFRQAYPGKPLCDIYAADSAAFRYEVKKWVHERAKAGAAGTYEYLFTLEFPFNGGTPAWHCSDIPFFFHNLDKAPVVNIEGVSDRLRDQIFDAFMQFVRTGKPDTKLLPKWPACTEDDEATMVFDRECEVRHQYDDAFIRLHYDLNVSPMMF